MPVFEFCRRGLLLQNLLKAREKDAETLQSAEKEISRLTEHLDKSNKEVANLLQQVRDLRFFRPSCCWGEMVQIGDYLVACVY